MFPCRWKQHEERCERNGNENEIVPCRLFEGRPYIRLLGREDVLKKEKRKEEYIENIGDVLGEKRESEENAAQVEIFPFRLLLKYQEAEHGKREEYPQKRIGIDDERDAEEYRREPDKDEGDKCGSFVEEFFEQEKEERKGEEAKEENRQTKEKVDVVDGIELFIRFDVVSEAGIGERVEFKESGAGKNGCGDARLVIDIGRAPFPFGNGVPKFRRSSVSPVGFVDGGIRPEAEQSERQVYREHAENDKKRGVFLEQRKHKHDAGLGSLRVSVCQSGDKFGWNNKRECFYCFLLLCVHSTRISQFCKEENGH